MLRKVAMPSFAQIRDNPSAVSYYFRRTFAVGALISFAVFFGIASVAPTAVPLILGEKWAPSTWLMFAVCLGMPFSSLIGLYGPTLQATGHHKLALANTTLALLLFLVTFTLGALNGPLGLATAWAVSFPILFTIVTFRSAPRLGVRPIAVFKTIAAPLAAAAIMLATNMAFGVFLPWRLHPIAMLLSQILLGIATYLLSIYLMDRKIIGSTVRMFVIKKTQPV